MLSWTTGNIDLCALPRAKGMRLRSLKCMQTQGEQCVTGLARRNMAHNNRGYISTHA